jgi:hypothetical protein
MTVIISYPFSVQASGESGASEPTSSKTEVPLKPRDQVFLINCYMQHASIHGYDNIACVLVSICNFTYNVHTCTLLFCCWSFCQNYYFLFL